jgi:hypothetical protein
VPRTGARVVVLALLAAPSASGQTPLSVPLERAGFEKIHHDRGVTVYSDKESRVLHFAAEGRFAAPPAEVQAVLLDYRGQAGHIGRISEVRVLARRPQALKVYLRLNLPIISDRDYTLALRWEQRDGVRWIRFKAARDGPAPRKGVVRMTLNEGSWQLRPTGGGRGTFARYELRMDIAGWVPAWLVRRAAGKEIPQVFTQFAGMLSARRR